MKLPDLRGTYCVTLTVCGNIQPTKQALAVKLRGKPMIAKYKTPTGLAYMRLLPYAYEKEEGHWHVDCSLDKNFPPMGGPFKVTHALARVLETLELAQGLKMKVSINARFVLPFAKLHENGLVHAFFFKTKIANMTVAMTGARFSLTGSPINCVTWYKIAKKKVVVDILTQRKMQIDEDYLQQALNWINDLANSFVL